MKTLIIITLLLIFDGAAGLAQEPKANGVPDDLKPPFAILNGAYPKVDAKKLPKAPTDSVWLFRSLSTASGTVEVGFQGADVVYMVFRRGSGGSAWTPQEIKSLHVAYYKTLLKEKRVDDVGGDRYNHSVAPRINAALITRKDFDVRSLFSGL